MQKLKETDPHIWQAITDEAIRQKDHIELIASENYVSANVLAAQGSILTNKYAEGYAGNRYYGGCQHVDTVEEIAIERAKKLFAAQYINVQPHSGTQANIAVYSALLKPGDTLLGMDLGAGGHLTHGSKVSVSGKIYNAVHYGLDPETECIDYEHVHQLAKQYQPKLIVAGFSAYPRQIDWQKFRAIADDVGAYLMVDMAHIAGLIAAGLLPSPLPYADVVTTTTHKTLRGPRGGLILSNREDLFKKLNSLVFPGTQGGPLMHVIAAKAVAFGEALDPAFKIYQQQVLKNAKALADTMQQQGFELVTGGTDNHLMLVKLIGKNITGREAEHASEAAHITINKNAIFNDPQPPSIASGIRIGTPAITTRGFKEKDCQQVGLWLAEVLLNWRDEKYLARISKEVCDYLHMFPVPA